MWWRQYSSSASTILGTATPSSPAKTFRALKAKKLRAYGEYRTKRLVLEAWERLEGW